MSNRSTSLKLRPGDLETIKKLISNPESGRFSQRARLILLRAEGHSINETAAALGTSRQTVALWQKRYLAEGISGLTGKAGGGKSGRLERVTRERILKAALDARKNGIDISCRGLSRIHGISPSTVSRLLKRHGLTLEQQPKGTSKPARNRRSKHQLIQVRAPHLRPTLGDVAQLAGVDSSTASRAINGRRGVSDQTRTKVDQAAKQLNYRKDPLLSGLAVHRAAMVASRRETTIAMVTDSRQNFPQFFNNIRVSIINHAKDLGFECEFMEIGPEETGPKRLRRVLLSRGISVLIFLPMSTPQRRLEINLDGMFPVAIGRTLKYPNIHRVAEDNRASVSVIIKHLREYGYKRFGMILPKWSDYRTEFSWRAGFLTEQSQLQSDEEAAIISPDRPDQHDTTWWRRQFDWIKSFKPDVLISLYKYETILTEASNNGIRIPEQMGYACLTSNGEDGPESGIYQNSRTVARLAVEKAVSLYYQNHQGVPSYPTTTLVAGNWAKGRTLIPREELNPLQ